MNLERTPLSIKRFVRRTVADAVNRAEVTHHLRIDPIEIAQTCSFVHRSAAGIRDLAELFASLRISRGGNVKALHVLFFSIQVDRKNDAFRVSNLFD